MFGVHVSVSGVADPAARIWTANHTSEMDALAIRCLANPHILGYSFYLQLWWLKFSPLSLLNMVYVPQRSRSEGNSDARDGIRKLVTELLGSSRHPILVFPEGGLTSGAQGLLQYHKFMYSLDVPIQPIRITISEPSFTPINIDFDNASFFMNVFWIAFVPVRRFHLHFMQSQHRREGEDALAFAQRAQVDQAMALRIKASPFLYKDKGHWLALKNAYKSEGIQLELVVHETEGCVSVVDASKRPGKKTSRTLRAVTPAGQGDDVSTERMEKESLKQRLIRDIHLKFGTMEKGFCHAVIQSQNSPEGPEGALS